MVYYLEFGDYCRIAAEILGLEPEQVAELPNIGLADSALAAPRAGFGETPSLMCRWWRGLPRDRPRPGVAEWLFVRTGSKN
jgi:hypothetical protein